MHFFMIFYECVYSGTELFLRIVALNPKPNGFHCAIRKAVAFLFLHQNEFTKKIKILDTFDYHSINLFEVILNKV